eukprot:PhF_6_TR23583/c0_g1_i1/m.33104
MFWSSNPGATQSTCVLSRTLVGPPQTEETNHSFHEFVSWWIRGGHNPLRTIDPTSYSLSARPSKNDENSTHAKERDHVVFPRVEKDMMASMQAIEEVLSNHEPMMELSDIREQYSIEFLARKKVRYSSWAQSVNTYIFR